MWSNRRWKEAMKSIVNRSVWSVMVRRGANVGREVLCTTLSAAHVLQMESKVFILVKRGIAVTKDKNNIGKTTSPTILKQEARVFSGNMLTQSMMGAKKEWNLR